MNHSLIGFLPITSEIEKRKLQFFGRLCNQDTQTLTKRIFLHRLFSYSNSLERKQFGYIHGVINILARYNLTQHLLIYLQVGHFPLKDLWNKTAKAAVTNIHINSRRQCMLSDPDFVLFNIINAGRAPFAIWKFPSNVHEIELC